MKLKMRKIVSMMAVLCLITGLFVLISSGESTHADTKELASIEVTKKPDKLLYEYGDLFDPTGIVITAHYTDGTSAPVNDYFWDWTGSLFYDITSIRISYTEGEITSNVDLAITVNPELEQLEVLTPPAKTVYNEGELFDPTGMVVQATYSNNTTEIITNYTVNFVGGLPTYGKASRDIDIEISYTYGRETEYAYQTVTVNRTEERTLTGLSINTSPDKLVYEEGESLNLSGLILIATYDNGKSVQVEWLLRSVTEEPGHDLFATDNKFTISYTENEVTKSVDQPITVNPWTKKLTDIAVTTPPTKVDYKVGESFKKNGMEVTATFDDGTQDILYPERYDVNPSGPLDIGDTVITITYTRGDGIVKTTTQNITVSPVSPLDRIEITTPPTKVEYVEGADFDLSGMVVTAFYEDGSSRTVTNYTVNPERNLSVTNTYVTISYTEDGITKTTTQPITVTGQVVITGITITTPPTKVEYVEGDQIDTTGMVVTATYSDGSTKVVKEADEYIEVTPLKNLKVTDTFITVKHTESDGTVKTTTQTITVKGKVTLTGITITTPPTKVEYVEGADFDLSGMVVTATYSDGSTKIVKSADEYIEVTPLKNLKVTDTIVTVTYSDGDGTVKTATQPITVKEKVVLTDIMITIPPTKVEYFEGDEFSTSGMVVVAKYSDNTTKVIKNRNEYILVEPLKNLQLTDSYVTVIYTDGDGTKKTATQPITVKEKATLTGITITTPPTKIEYFEGDEFSTGGMVVVAKYSNDTTEVIKNEDEYILVEPLKNLQLTDSYVTVIYTDGDGTEMTTTQPITVRVKPILTGIKITTPPTKTEYMVGDTFDQGGMVVVAEYHDGSTKVIKEADGFINLTPLYNLQTTDSYITLSYAEEDISVTTKQYIVVKSNGSSSNYGNGQSSSGSGSNSGNYGSGSNTGNSGSGSSTGISVSTPTPTPKVVIPGTTTQEVENKDGSKTITTKTVEESGKVTETTVKENKNGDKTTTEVVTDNSGKMVSTVTEIVSTDNKGTTTVTTTDRKNDGSVTGSTVKTYESGKVVSTTTETNADKSVKIVEETKQADGSTTKTVTKVSAGGSAKMTVTAETPAADDKEAKKTEFVYSMTEAGKAKLVKVTTNETEITIPATVTINDIQCKVVTIGKDAFKGNTSITKVVLGKYVETIGTKAFAGLKNLKEITISSSKLSKVSKSAFSKISKEAKFYIKAKKSVCKSIAALITKSGVKKVNYERVK